MGGIKCSSDPGFHSVCFESFGVAVGETKNNTKYLNFINKKISVGNDGLYLKGKNSSSFISSNKKIPSKIVYADFLDSYYFVDNGVVENISNTKEYNLIILSRDGSVKKRQIPEYLFGLYERLSQEILSKVGLLYGSYEKRESHKNGKTNDLGLYLIDGSNGLLRVIKGWVKRPAISKDGCLLAITHFSNIEDARPIKGNKTTLKIIGFCDN